MADTSYPAFMDLVKRSAQEDYRDEDLTSEVCGFSSSFDPLLQNKAEKAVQDTVQTPGPAEGRHSH